jgi:serine protease Do
MRHALHSAAAQARCLRWLMIAMALSCAAVRAEALDAATQQKVRAATFEVVMLKPDESSITYEKPLPLELLPYQIRNDKYYSVGTAFAIGEQRFITAAHVLSAGFITQWGAPALRDGSGRVYPIDKILKYSGSQDFAEFSVVGDPALRPLDIGPHPEPGETVYAAGNALGEGVIIRDGSFTSETPEEVDGRWKWLRFSAAASPGNSGGPLLDKDGKVIGVVLRKSPNENLNYALSIDDLLAAKDGTAVFDGRISYSLDVFDFKQIETFKNEISLPKGFAEFGKAYTDLLYPFEDQELQHLLNNHARQIFPQGEGSIELLHSIHVGVTPGLVMRRQDGLWEVRRPNQESRSELGHNGFVSAAHINKTVLLRMRRPDNVPAEQFYSDSRTYMDTLLKAEPITRQVGEESVKIVSLGEAQRDAQLIDNYQRKWQLRQWPVPFIDAVIVSLALPVPDGYIALVRIVPTSRLHANFNDFRAMVNFVDVSYGGTLAQWQEFDRMKDWLPSALQSIAVDFVPGQSLSYSSPRFSFSYTTALQPITLDSELFLNFDYFDDHGHTVWDIVKVLADVDAHTKTYVSVWRMMQPDSSMGDDAKSNWTKLIRRQHPYDSVVRNENDLSSIVGVLQPAGTGKDAVMYSIRLQNDGAASQEVMRAKLDLSMQGLSAKDDRAPD